MNNIVCILVTAFLFSGMLSNLAFGQKNNVSLDAEANKMLKEARAFAKDNRLKESSDMAEKILRNVDLPNDLRHDAMKILFANLKSSPKDLNSLADSILKDAAMPKTCRQTALQLLGTAVVNADKSNAAQLRSLVPSDMMKEMPSDVKTFMIVQNLFVLMAKKHNDNALMREASLALLENPGVPAADRIEAAWRVAEILLYEEKIEDAEKLVRAGFEYENLTPSDYAALYANLGKLLSMKGRPDEAIASYRKILEKNPGLTEKVNAMIVNEYVWFHRMDEALKVCRDAGDRLGEARILRDYLDKAEDAKKIALSVLSDESANKNLRCSAAAFFLDSTGEDKEVRMKYSDFFRTSVNPAIFNSYAVFPKRLFQVAMWEGNFEFALELLSYMQDNPKVTSSFIFADAKVNALLGTGRKKEAVKAASEYAGMSIFTNEQRYQMALAADLFARNEITGAVNDAIKSTDKSMVALKLSAAEKAEAVAKVAASALTAGDTIFAKELSCCYESLYKHHEKKTYHVKFSSAPVSSSGFSSNGKMAEIQFLDRKFKVNLDFLETDVSSGDRGIVAGAPDNKVSRPNEFSATCDANGVHLLFRIYGDSAKGDNPSVSPGALEIYFAPGENQPYMLFLLNLKNAECTLWQTAYNNEKHRRMVISQDCKQEILPMEDGLAAYVYFSWNYFYDKLPVNGYTWDFEVIHWSQAGAFTWNGLRGTHARSSWGRLAFDINQEQLNAIKKKIIFRAKDTYQREKITSNERSGSIDYWKDPVLGDLDFYESVLAPYSNKLDAFLPMVKPDMTDKEVEQVFIEAVPGWNEFRFKASAMRRAYLEEQLVK